MSELIIKLNGEVTDTNFDEWKNDLLTKLKQVNTELATDDDFAIAETDVKTINCLLYTSPSPRDGLLSRMPSSA